MPGFEIRPLRCTTVKVLRFSVEGLTYPTAGASPTVAVHETRDLAPVAATTGDTGLKTADETVMTRLLNVRHP
jgi:hypothetical protein